MAGWQLKSINKEKFLDIITNEKTVVIMTSLLICVMLIDVGISNLTDVELLDAEFFSNNAIIPSFVIFLVILVVAQYILFRFIWNTMILKYVRPSQVAFHKALKYIQIFITSLVLSITLQILFFSGYYTVTLLTLEITSMLLTMVIIAVLTYRFLKWYKVSQNFTILLFCVAFISFNINFLFNFILDMGDFYNRVPMIRHDSEVESGNTFLSDDMYDYLFYWLDNIGIISFFFMWLSTALIFSHKSAKIGRIKYWFLISLPLTYYISYYISYQHVDTHHGSFAVFYNLIYLYGFIAGTSLIGVIFFVISRVLAKKNDLLRTFGLLTLFGFILSSIASYSYIYLTLYPPFGAVSFAMLGFSVYLIYIGIFSSAVLISKDYNLRRHLTKYMRELKFYDNIGTAQMEAEIHQTVSALVAKNAKTISNESGMNIPVSKEEIQDNINLVLKEINRMSPK